jgi:DNA-binding MarR family transcriptional regulator
MEDDRREKTEIEQYIDLLNAQKVKPQVPDEIVLPPPPRAASAGDIFVGDILYAGRRMHPFNIHLKDLTRHAGIFGSTRSGKTTFAHLLINELHKKGVPFMVFDWEKSYRNLVTKYPDVTVFTVGNDEVNPLFLNFLTVPPGIQLEEYMKSIISIISEDYIGGIGADTMLLHYMEMAYSETGHPYFQDLSTVIMREIDKDKGRGGRLAGRSGLWKETVGRQVLFMSKGAAGTINNASKQHDLADLFSKNVVLEFGNFHDPHDKKFFIHLIMNWRAIYMQHAGIHSEQLRQVNFFEEFHNIAMKGKEDNMISTLFREAGKYGLGLVAIDQTPSEIPNAIFANMNTKVAFSLGTAQDITAMAKAMHMPHDQARFFGMLTTGQAIIKANQRYPHAFLINPPYVDQGDNIWDTELRERMQQSTDKLSLFQPAISENRPSQSLQKQEKAPPLTPHEKLVLTSIIEHPFAGVEKRIKLLGLHSSEVAKLQDALTTKGFVTPVWVDRKKLFELTEAGRTVAQLSKLPLKQQKSRGGLEHAYWVAKIAQFLSKLEFQPVSEHSGIDIRDLSEKISIEVETGKSNIKANLLKLEFARVSENHRCFLLGTMRAPIAKIRQLAEPYPLITVMRVNEFLTLTPKALRSAADNEPAKGAATQANITPNGR